MIFAHIIDSNLGDVVCSPKNYLQFPDSQEKDFRQVPIEAGPPIIIGGGGMLYPGVDDWIEAISKVRDVILWGVGLNYDSPEHALVHNVKEKLKHCKLVGLRDQKFATENGYDFVPCVSCLHASFNLPCTLGRGEAVYEHLHHPISIEELPKMNNKADKSLRDVIIFFRGFKRIITNSYHGAYWASLLQKEVQIWKPFSMRFLDIPTQGAEFCRDLNYSFYKKVKAIL